jgi:hypothetical protein
MTEAAQKYLSATGCMFCQQHTTRLEAHSRHWHPDPFQDHLHRSTHTRRSTCIAPLAPYRPSFSSRGCSAWKLATVRSKLASSTCAGTLCMSCTTLHSRSLAFCRGWSYIKHCEASVLVQSGMRISASLQFDCVQVRSPCVARAGRTLAREARVTDFAHQASS